MQTEISQEWVSQINLDKEFKLLVIKCNENASSFADNVLFLLTEDYDVNKLQLYTMYLGVALNFW